jgi:hypoxanthine phosphoribosyltransferase
MRIIEAHSSQHIEIARTLFAEYARDIKVDLCFQNFSAELAGLPGKYSPHRGRLLLALAGGKPAGCVALREIGGGICEMKRLYVSPAFRGKGLGAKLAGTVITAAREIGYERMRLDTLGSMKHAIALYESLGFQRIAPYYNNPINNAVFMELELHRKTSRQRRSDHYHRAMSKPATRLAPARTIVPPRWRKDVERILITDEMLARRIRQMSREIERDFTGREMVIVSLLNGTVMFLADLIRHISLPLRLDFMGVSSYGAGTESGELVFTKELRLDVRDRDVLLVDDILDTGKTMRRVLEKLCLLGPRRVHTCVLLDKPTRRVEKVQADYVGFEIPDFFVVGYGLDYAERYRNLPFVGVLHPHMYKKASH